MRSILRNKSRRPDSERVMVDEADGAAPQFEAVFEAHRAAVLAYVRRRLEAKLAEDAVAETFAIAWRRRNEIPSEPLLWLYSTARGVVSNQRRSEYRRRRLADRLTFERSATGDDPARLVADRLELARAFDSLDENDQELLMLVAWEGLTPRQGATVLGCSSAAFRVRVHRARKRFEQGLAEALPKPVEIGVPTESTPVKES